MKNTLERVFPIYAQAIAGQIGVKLQIGGNQAYCGNASGNTKLINLPALPLDDAEIAKAAWGYLYHEGFHAKYSSTEVLFNIAGKPLRKTLLHIIEDVWNEHHMPKEFLSSKVHIDAMNRYILDKGWFSGPVDGEHPSAVLTNYILLWGLGYHNDTDFLKPLADEYEDALRNILSPGAMTKLNAVLETGMPMVNSTEDGLALVDRIVDLLEEEDLDDDSNDGSNSGQGSDDDSNDGSNSGQGSDDDSNDGSNSGQDLDDDSNDGSNSGQGSDDDSNDGSNSSQCDQNSDGASGSHEDVASSSNSVRRSIIKEILNATDDQIPDHHLSQLEQHMQDEGRSTGSHYRVAKPAPAEACPRVPGRGARALKNALANSNAVRKEMQRIFESQQRTRPRLRDHGNRICPNRMPTVMFGNPEVFIQRRHQRNKSAAIHLLLDASPSMSSRINMAIEATMSIGLAIERIRGVNLAITRFPVDQFHDGILYDDDVQPLISSGESIAANASRFDIETMGVTPMADAMWYCIHQLMAQKEDRKILLIVTDGQPSNEASVNELLEKAGPSGIEVMALGINEASVKRIFPIAETITDINQLSSALFEMVGAALLKAS